MNDLDKVRNHEVDLSNISDTALNAFLEEFNLLDPRKFALSSTWALKFRIFYSCKVEHPKPAIQGRG